jgi:hypothetical protein
LGALKKSKSSDRCIHELSVKPKENKSRRKEKEVKKEQK